MKKFAFDEIYNFFTKEQRLEILDKVIKLNSKWRKLHEYPVYDNPEDEPDPCSKNQYLLGDSIYPIENVEEIDQEVQTLLKSEFNDLIYKRLLNEIPKHFGPDIQSCSFYDDLPVPGFHIFSGIQDESDPFPYHTDVSLALWKKDVYQNRIYSFLSPIIMPPNGAHLQWKQISGKESKMNYRYGSLHFWNGLVPHRIGSHALKQGEMRITLQGHLYIDPDKNIKIYF